MDVEKISTSSVDKEEKEFFSFGGSETQKITRSSNPPIKATIFWNVITVEGSLGRDKSLDTGGRENHEDIGGRENHGCDGLIVSRRPLTYGWML
jgi:hypothetical protein